MKVSYNWLQSFFAKKLPSPEKLAEFLTTHSFEVSDLKEIRNPKFPPASRLRRASEIRNKSKILNSKFKTRNDWVLDVDVLPNRTHDCLSHLGIVREISTILQLSLRGGAIATTKQSSSMSGVVTNVPPARLLRFARNDKQEALSVSVLDKNLCPRYTARVLTGIKVGSSPKWMRERLEAVGVIPRNNIVDILNYIMMELGQPLHAFDFDKVEADQPRIVEQSSLRGKRGTKRALPAGRQGMTRTIVVRRAREGEDFISLDSEKYKLDKDVLVIADAKEPIALAGIKGGKKAEITRKTETIILESANFDALSIRRSSRKLNLRTESSMRFEAELDPNLASIAINRAAGLIQELAGGEIIERMIDYYPEKVLPKKMKLDLDYVKNLLGIDISQKEIVKILAGLGFIFRNDNIIVEVPTRRLDINIPEDLIEEIGRIYGYDRIKPVLPTASIAPPRPNKDLEWRRKIKTILSGVGFVETINYSFISDDDNKFFGFPNSPEVLNSVSNKYSFLRPFLLINLLKNAEFNFKYFDDINLFEIGKVYSGRIYTDNAPEPYALAGLIGSKNKAFAKSGFYDLKGVLEHLLESLGIADVFYNEAVIKNRLFAGKASARIKVANETLGMVGKIDRKILDYLGIKNNVFAFEIDLEGLVKIASEEIIYEKPSAYPAATRDISMLVEPDTRVADILNVIHRVGKELVSDVNLFDIYSPEGRQSLAFHVIYQSDKRTLTDGEINNLHGKIEKALKEELGAEIRK